MSEVPESGALLVLRSTAWQWAFKAVTLALGFVSISLVTRLLGPGDYGRVGVATTYVGFVVALSDLGLPTIVARDVARAPDALRGHVTTATWGRALLFVPTYALALAVAVPLYRHDPVVLGAIAIGLLMLLPSAVTSTLAAVLQVQARLHVAAALELGARAVTVAATVAVLRNGGGVRGVVVVMVAVTALHCAVVVRLLARHLGGWSAWDGGSFRRLVRAALPLGVAVVLNSLYFRMDTIVLSLLRPAADVGVYVAAYRVMELMLVFPSLFAAAALPLLSRAATGGDRLMPLVAKCLRLVVTILLPLTVVVAVDARRILVLLGGSAFAPGEAAMRVLAFAALVSGLNIVLGLAIVALDRQGRALWLNVGALTLNVVLNLALDRRGGPPVAAALTLGCEALVVVGASLVVRRATGSLPSVPYLGRLLVCAAAAAGVLALLPGGLGVVPRGLAVGVAYAGLLLMTRAVTVEDVRLLRAAA
ncbi:MAG TPA: oligosaccharide flippase family protein [Mycobacteriales bacterium]|nr:oligosaccharide flippase family protein [Mycobacteriales bacterium]